MAIRLWLITRLLVLALIAVVGADRADARAIKWARSGDALTLDPHAQNEGPTHALGHQIYEPLIVRDNLGKAVPALAESWSITTDPLVWEFKLRKGVTFHDGSPFTADDVIYSFNRARQPTSDMKSLLSSVDVMTKVDDHTLRIKTKGPNPIFPSNLNNLLIMSRGWTEKHGAGTVQDFKGKKDNYAVLNANGTGPYELVSRVPDVKTELKRNDNYWGKGQVPLEITEITYLPIQSDAARTAALLSGEVDFVQDMPVGELEKIASNPKLRVNVGPENRSIFLGLNVGDPELKSSDVKGRNPFADKRVRAAINMTVNRAQIQKVTMRGQSLPTGTIVPPGVNGYTKELDIIPAADPAKAKALMAEAGFADGFTVTFNCPNDRYVNDEAICKAIATQLATIGIKANLVAEFEDAVFSAAGAQSAGNRPLSSRLGRADLRQPLYLRVPVSHPHRQGGRLECDPLLQPRDRRADRGAHQGDRSHQARPDDGLDLEGAAGRDDLHSDTYPDAGLRDEARSRHRRRHLEPAEDEVRQGEEASAVDALHFPGQAGRDRELSILLLDDLSIGAVLGQHLALFLDRAPLLVEVARHRAAQGRIGDPVGTIGGGRQVAAGKLVLALGTGLDPRQLVADGVVDRLVVAELEMQAGVVLDRAPVAAVQAVAADQVERARHRPPIAHGEDQQAAIGHRLAQPGEEFAIEVGPAPLAAARVHVEGEERVPVGFGDVRAPAGGRSRARRSPPASAPCGSPCACAMTSRPGIRRTSRSPD